jgi:xanthosine utilization system XapX-like protein
VAPQIASRVTTAQKAKVAGVVYEVVHVPHPAEGIIAIVEKKAAI